MEFIFKTYKILILLYYYGYIRFRLCITLSIHFFDLIFDKNKFDLNFVKLILQCCYKIFSFKKNFKFVTKILRKAINFFYRKMGSI